MARFCNQDNNAVLPLQENLIAAAADIELTQYDPIASKRAAASPASLVGSLSARAGPQSYPFSRFGYLVFRTSASDSNCVLLSKFFDVLLWLQSYTIAVTLQLQTALCGAMYSYLVY